MMEWAPTLPTKCHVCDTRIWPWSRDAVEGDDGSWLCSYPCWSAWAQMFDVAGGRGKRRKEGEA